MTSATATTRTRRSHRVTLALTLAVTVCEWTKPSSYITFRPLITVLLLAAGVLHGAFDWSIAGRVGSTKSRPFFAAYLLSMAGVCLAWLSAPLISLVAFVALSAYHFGEGELHAMGHQPTVFAALSRGLVVLVVPLIWHFDAIVPILSSLLQTSSFDTAVLTPLFRHALIALILAQHLAWLLAGPIRQQVGREVVRLSVLLTMLVSSDVLLGFSVYFTLWHSLDHVQIVRDRVLPAQPSKTLRTRTATIALASIVGVATVTLVCVYTQQTPSWALVFMALSAVTFPHAWLVRRLLSRSAPHGSSSAKHLRVFRASA